MHFNTTVKMNRMLYGLFAFAFLLSACGQSYEEKQRLSREARLQEQRADSAALKIAVMPTLDCLPLFVAEESGLFGLLGADIRLKMYMAQMDCDTAVVNGRVEGVMTDLVRMECMGRRGTFLVPLTATDAAWQLVANRKSRISKIGQLEDKMVAMTRFSATHLLSDVIADSAAIKSEYMFRVQVNDVQVRQKMLENNQMDALFLAEPYAAMARQDKHKLLFDTRKADIRLGVLAVRKAVETDTARKRQADVLVKAYSMACDSINKHGVAHYAELLKTKFGMSQRQIGKMPAARFSKAGAPREKDMAMARQWVNQAIKAKEEYR